MVLQKSKVDLPLIFYWGVGVKLKYKPFGEFFEGPIPYLLRIFFQLKCGHLSNEGLGGLITKNRDGTKKFELL